MRVYEIIFFCLLKIYSFKNGLILHSFLFPTFTKKDSTELIIILIVIEYISELLDN